MHRKDFNKKLYKRSDYGIENDAFVFFLCSRAIPEKGWEQAIKAFEILKSKIEISKPLHLFFVGGGEYATKLENKYSAVVGLHFLGNRNDLHLLIPMFDVCLLPTYFESESQPMIIIDSLMQNKPIIATVIGEIPQMLEDGEKFAGLLVPLVKNRPDMQILVEQMTKFVKDENDVYTKAKSGCEYLFKRFDIKGIIENYFETIKFK
jgi:glycosyltransferase involved in cell wall biosynthesis